MQQFNRHRARRDRNKREEATGTVCRPSGRVSLPSEAQPPTVTVRKRLATLCCGRWTFAIERNPAADPFGIVIWVFIDGKPLRDISQIEVDHGKTGPCETVTFPVHFRKSFPSAQKMSCLRRFCMIFANHPGHRNRLLSDFYSPR